MIPRHLLPLRLKELPSLVLGSGAAPTAADLEQSYAEALGAQHVLLFPSARAAIYVLIRAACPPGANVLCPAYTCDVVHQALDLVQARARYVDAAPGSFLISPADLEVPPDPQGALVLSEMYGIPYDAAAIDGVYPSGACLRIFDLAMCIPEADRIGRLQARDVAIYSFGWGKPMYAGWGAIACFRDSQLAEQTRAARDKWMGGASSSLRPWHQASVLARIVLNERLPHGILQTPFFRAVWRTVLRWGKAPQGAAAFDREPSDDTRVALHSTHESKRFLELAHEWTQPTSPLDRALALHNLQICHREAETRRDQARIYWKLLIEPGTFPGPAPEALPQSHFPLRLAAANRDWFRKYLSRRGIDTSILFALPPGLSRGLCPHAARAADEVVTLPMGGTISSDEVEMIAACAKAAASVRPLA